MVQPTARILTEEKARAAAGMLQTPSEVRAFIGLRSESSAVRAFLHTAEWAAIRERIMGDGTPPIGRLRSPRELARFFRWTADGEFGTVSPDARAAYLHAAEEAEALARTTARKPLAPVADDAAA